MSSNVILALVDPANGVNTLQVAKLASSAIGAVVDGVAIKPDPMDSIPLVTEGLTGDVVQQFMDAATVAGNAAATASKAIFETGGLGPAATWVEFTGRTSNVLAREGRLRTLSVVSSGDTGDAILTAMFDTGRPVLIAPSDEVGSVGKTVAIFWKDSAEAAKAVWEAMPFLRQANRIKAFTLGDDKESEASLQGLATSLARAGITIETALIDGGHDRESERLLSAAAEMDADLIVMGAFSHSRLRELVLGGVTQDILEIMDRPIFAAH